jgi:hypothetical protein
LFQDRLGTNIGKALKKEKIFIDRTRWEDARRLVLL